MSCKLSINNSIKLNSDSQQWVKASSIDSNVKLAGEEAKDRLYEPKHKKKLVRVLTVVAYVFFVSLAAIMLSLYYVFLWSGNQKDTIKDTSRPIQQTHNMCNNGENVLLDVPYEPTAIPVLEATTPSPIATTDISSEWSSDYKAPNFTDSLIMRNPLIKKLILKNGLD
ncbi:PREDICTED: uncharacterized protein LOC108567908 [Nicrophorus vespilloides]|uniref:Uncharacterized protein LOC108567908 n=1 Tax=Nicrophorus vespilloides TaxID=110193 RepID=A0ABM1NBH5_NICVS|nr:PREDICTED: uncharacterized protein LOC108567908 [Nicrophorus vespilloides]